jgi:glycosyltransferase involved in cell wall biosynthesis
MILMKVLFTFTTKPGFYDAYVHRVMSLKNGLESCGVQSAALYLGDLPFKKPFVISPVNVPVIRKYLEEFDFVHAGNTGAAYLMSLAKLTRKTDTRVIYDVHGDAIEEPRLNCRGWLDLKNHFNYLQGSVMEKLAARYADYFAVCSESFRDRYLSRGVNRDRVEVILNGVNIDMFRPRDHPQNEVFTVTYAGRFQRWQGIELLLEATQLLKDEGVRFRVIGLDPGTRQALEGKYGNVQFMDFMPGSELIGYLCGSDALIIPRMSHPALEVAFPTKYAEYVACGVPVIVTDVGDAGRLTRRHNSGMVCDTSAVSIAEAILKLKSCSPGERKEMGDNGRRLAEDLLDYRKISMKYFEFLKRAGETC